ncbi:hypothetical protein ABT403_34745 [Streptomyces sp. NPDC000075]|uniref:hypothetical protein n=1 Tax=Streptomyces TaxID=1883 RepID=UPI0031E309A3
MDLGILAGAAVGIVGDFLAGVVQNMAAGAVTDLVRQRLRSTDDGTRALARLEEAPQESGRRMEAASTLASAARSDPSFAQALNDAVNDYHQYTNQGTSTSGSPHHQVNISGGGISGKGHQVAGGNIDNSKKRNIRIGFGVLALLALVLGGYGVTQWVGGGSGGAGQSPISGDGLLGSGIGNSATVKSKTLTYDLRQGDPDPESRMYRSSGSLVATPGAAVASHSACQLNAPSGTSIVPVKVQLTNANSPQWDWSQNSKDEAETVTVTAKAPDGIATHLHIPEDGSEEDGLRDGACVAAFSLSSRSVLGGSRTVDLLLVGVPQGKNIEITLDVAGPDCCFTQVEDKHATLKFTVRG